MNILYGLAAPDEGEILLDGKPVQISRPVRRDRPRHQHGPPALHARAGADRGREHPARRGDDGQPASSSTAGRRAERIRELGRRFGFEIDPDAKVGSLSVGWQQRVEILKALYRDARILVLDEPTAVLTPRRRRRSSRSCAAWPRGRSIIFISHKLYEVLEIADRITVIRRGKVVGERIPPRRTRKTSPS